jgi:hypothetical protein
MQPPKSSTPGPSTEPASEPRKNWREAALTSTPIVLTVLATALAGLSSSEMTLAQYHRSLAAQNQSKASDQWAFFQAKRMRETGMEVAGDLIPARFKPGNVDPNLLKADLDRLVNDLRLGEKQAGRLIQTIDAAQTTLGSAAGPIQREGEKLQKTAKNAAEQVEKIKQTLAQELEREQVRLVFAYLAADKLPEVQDSKIDSPDIEKAVQAISDRLPEAEMNPLLRNIKEDDLNRAIEIAEANARRFEVAAKPGGKTLDDIDKLLNQIVAQAASFHQAVRALNNTYAEVFASEKADGGSNLQKAVAQVDRADTAVQAAAEELNNTFKVGRYGYTGRRQGREASYNLKTAGLYEVQVRLNSLNSGRHRTRSKLFFFGMLAAQAGVTVASLSLAVRQRNILWGLAGLAGIGAVLFSGYVYLYM